MKQVDVFISRFHRHETTRNTFLLDCAYWFAFILFRRFLKEGAKIMFDKSANHFGTMIAGRVYDITGDVTQDFKWIPWETINSDDKEQIIQNYIMF